MTEETESQQPSESPQERSISVTEEELKVICRHAVWAFNVYQFMNKYVGIVNHQQLSETDHLKNTAIARMFMSYWAMTLHEIYDYKHGALCVGLTELDGIKNDLSMLRQTTAHVVNRQTIDRAFEPIVRDAENKMMKFHAAHWAIINRVFELAEPFEYIKAYLNLHIPVRELV